MKEIIEITSNGIGYVDEDGNAHFVDFEICYRNFLKNRQKQMEPRYDDELKRLDREWKSVGYRRISGPYIEFFTIPPTRFDFSSVGKFSEIAHKVRKAGWATIDGD